MAKKSESEGKIVLKQDKRNYRIHNDRNKGIIKKSLEKLGAGRSILIDSDNNIIAGNGVAEQWGDKPIKIVETNGKELIAVKRTDLKPGSVEAVELGIVDNHASDTSEMDLKLLAEDFNVNFFDEWDMKIPNLEMPIIEPDDLGSKSGSSNKFRDLNDENATLFVFINRNTFNCKDLSADQKRVIWDYMDSIIENPEKCDLFAQGLGQSIYELVASINEMNESK
jgi:hypothetical protein